MQFVYACKAIPRNTEEFYSDEEPVKLHKINPMQIGFKSSARDEIL